MSLFLKILIVLALLHFAYVIYSKYAVDKALNSGIDNISTIPDSPIPFGYKLVWLAIPTKDSNKVINALGKHHKPIPANWKSGMDFIYNTHDCVFVSPSVNGWVFVIGTSLGTLTHEAKENESFLSFLKMMSLKLPKVLYFATHRVVEFHSWIIAQNSKILRAFAYNGERGELYSEGNITDTEMKLGVAFSHIDELEERYPEEDEVIKLAEEWSINPLTLDQYSDQKGCGVLIKWN